MKYDPSKHHRRSLRLKGYDYSQEGAYYVTIVTRQCNYYEHIIRDETDLERIRAYIIDTPANWDMDPENPRLERIQ